MKRLLLAGLLSLGMLSSAQAETILPYGGSPIDVIPNSTTITLSPGTGAGSAPGYRGGEFNVDLTPM